MQSKQLARRLASVQRNLFPEAVIAAATEATTATADAGSTLGAVCVRRTRIESSSSVERLGQFMHLLAAVVPVPRPMMHVAG